MCFAQTKATSRRPRLADPFEGSHYEWYSLQIQDIQKLFVLQFRLRTCNFTQWGECFQSDPQESLLPSPCNLQTGLLLPPSSKCLSIMQRVVSLNRCPEKYLHKKPQICSGGVKRRQTANIKDGCGKVQIQTDFLSMSTNVPIQKCKTSQQCHKGSFTPATNLEVDLCFCSSNERDICHF